MNARRHGDTQATRKATRNYANPSKKIEIVCRCVALCVCPPYAHAYNAKRLSVFLTNAHRFRATRRHRRHTRPQTSATTTKTACRLACRPTHPKGTQ
jgi:hypothetical protein